MEPPLRHLLRRHAHAPQAPAHAILPSRLDCRHGTVREKLTLMIWLERTTHQLLYRFGDDSQDYTRYCKPFLTPVRLKFKRCRERV